MTDPQRATPGGSGQANADQKTATVSIGVGIDAARKQFAALQVQAVLAVHLLHLHDDGTCILSRPDAYRQPPTLREVGDMLRRMGAAR